MKTMAKTPVKFVKFTVIKWVFDCSHMQSRAKRNFLI